MEKRKIGEDAGTVWRILNATETKSCDYESLKKESKLDERAINRAIGWLAREEKICIYEENNTISLMNYHYY